MNVVENAMDTVAELFGQNPHWAVLRSLIDQAEKQSVNTVDDVDNIRILGEGRVAEETLAIAIYCVLQYSDNFSKGVTTAVNHSGNSDSTGAVTGNILGAWLGRSAIQDKWTCGLELQSIILEMADDLCCGCPLDEHGNRHAPVWERKYILGRYFV